MKNTRETIKKILTRGQQPTDELTRVVNEKYKGLELEYVEVYYLDYEVDENTGKVNKEIQVPHYTSDQMDRNLKALKSAFNVAKGAASPKEILEFREKYHIPASIFSVVLGFSKNTISNIEQEGALSLPSGRLIKVVMNDKHIMCNYISSCDALDLNKREELVKAFC
jgi:DNA-binding transcriptional regulator YiaG